MDLSQDPEIIYLLSDVRVTEVTLPKKIIYNRYKSPYHHERGQNGELAVLFEGQIF